MPVRGWGWASFLPAAGAVAAAAAVVVVLVAVVVVVVVDAGAADPADGGRGGRSTAAEDGAVAFDLARTWSLVRGGCVPA